MHLNCETVFDLYTHKNKNVLCQIKVLPKSSVKNPCRFLSKEHWYVFDKEIEKIITNVEEWDSKKCLEFNIMSDIQVRVKKSKISLQSFYNCLDIIDYNDYNKNNEADLVLECIFHIQLKVPFSCSNESQELEPCTEVLLDSVSCSPLSYIPYTPSKNKSNDVDTVKTPGTEFLEGDENSYSAKLIHEKATFESPLTKPLLSETSSSNDNKSYDKEEEGQYKIFQINNLGKRKKRSDSILLDLNEENIKHLSKKKQLKRTGNTNSECDIKVTKKRSESINKIPDVMAVNAEKSCEKLSSKEKKNNNVCSSAEKNTLSQKEAERSSSEDELEFSKRNKKLPTKPPIEGYSLTDKNIKKLLRREIKHKSSRKGTRKSLRRSERSSTKSEQIKIKSKNRKSFTKSKDLFGADDDDDLFENNNPENVCKDKKIQATIYSTPVSKKSAPCTSSSSSSKNKRKKDKITECQQEKLSISKWLSKNKSVPLNQEVTKTTKTKIKSLRHKHISLKTSIIARPQKIEDGDLENRPQSVIPLQTALELPSKEELELIRNKTKLMQKENARVRAELDKMRTSPPKEVEILSLDNVSLSDILNTFITYKSELDEIYENNCKRDYIKGHDGINHCFVIKLLQKNIQMKMLEKLTEVYNNSKTATQATLFANALLPEWIIRVYMEKFDFTRQQAIAQIKAQDEFQLHMDDQNDDPFVFD